MPKPIYLAVVLVGLAGFSLGTALSRDDRDPAGPPAEALLDAAELGRQVATAVSRANGDLVRAVLDDRVACRRCSEHDVGDVGAGRASSPAREPDTIVPSGSVVPASRPGLDEDRVGPQRHRLAAMLAWHEDESLRKRWILRSRSAVAAWFGTPGSVGVNSHGVEIWRYELAGGRAGAERSVSLRFSSTGLIDVDG